MNREVGFYLKKKAVNLDLTKLPSTPFVKSTQALKAYWEKVVQGHTLRQLYPKKKFSLNTRMWNNLTFVQDTDYIEVRVNRVVTLTLDKIEVPVQLHIKLCDNVNPSLKPYWLKGKPFMSLGADFILTERGYHIPLGYTTKEEMALSRPLYTVYRALLKIRKEHQLVGEVKITRTALNQIVEGYLKTGESVRLIYSQVGVLREKSVNGEVVDVYKKFGEVDKPKVIRKGSSTKKKVAG